jgi:uncharacterized protein with ParB-like and HNH nuclease domain
METVFSGFEFSLKRRGKFFKKNIPLLSDTHNEMLRCLTEIDVIRQDVQGLIEKFKTSGKLSGTKTPKAKKSTISASKKTDISSDADIEFEDGDTDYEIDYNADRKIFTQKAEYSVEYLHKLARRGRLDLQPDFQRQFVWDANKASSLIESLLLDVPIPVVYLAEDDDGTFSVIDGQQRLGSIFSFINGIFPGDRPFNLLGLKVLRGLNGKPYRDIDPIYQDKLDTATLSTIIIKKESDPELKFEIFERLNTGSVRLNDQELRNCIYRGDYLNLLKELSADAEFRYIMGLKKTDKRMKDVEYVLRFAAFYHKAYLNFAKARTMKTFLNGEMALHRTLSEQDAQDLREAFKKAVQINKSLFGNRSFRRVSRGDKDDPNASWKNSSVVNGALFDVMMTYFLDKDKNIIFRNLDSIREAYIHLLTENEEFVDTIEKWTNSYNQIRKKFQIFDQTMTAIFDGDSIQDRCFSSDLKERLFKLYNTCAICGQKILMVEDSAVDHVEQYWLGGKTIPENARLTHRYCNGARPRKEDLNSLPGVMELTNSLTPN